MLFNLGDDGAPVIRKASAHGLGHIRAPYDRKRPARSIPAPVAKLSDVGVELWQHDVWWTIAKAAVEGRPDQAWFDYHPALAQPAVSRYAATRPSILAWLKGYNKGRPYAERVKPFGFLLSLFADPFFDGGTWPGNSAKPAQYRPIAPFDQDHMKAVANAFDRQTGEPVPAEALKSVGQVIDLYHLNSESKFLNGDGLDRGVTHRRHIRATGVNLIGKEANRWEEQYFLGLDDEAQPDYGAPPADLETKIAKLRAVTKAHGAPALARKADVPVGRVRRAMKMGRTASPGLIERLSLAADDLEAATAEHAREHAKMLNWARQRIEVEGIGAFARATGIDPRNLRKVLDDRRSFSAAIMTRLSLASAIRTEFGP